MMTTLRALAMYLLPLNGALPRVTNDEVRCSTILADQGNHACMRLTQLQRGGSRSTAEEYRCSLSVADTLCTHRSIWRVERAEEASFQYATSANEDPSAEKCSE